VVHIRGFDAQVTTIKSVGLPRHIHATFINSVARLLIIIIKQQSYVCKLETQLSYDTLKFATISTT